MGSVERREAILRYLYRRQYASIGKLADMFSVSYSTIRRDIDALSLSAPIVIDRGRYTGGVRVVKYIDNYMITSEDELIVLHKLYLMATNESPCLLNDNEMKTFKSIIQKYMFRQK